MLQIVGFVVVLAVVYAVKALAVVRTHEELAEQSVAFSWTAPRPEDVETAAAWAVEEEAAARAASNVSLPALRQAGGARA